MTTLLDYKDKAMMKLKSPHIVKQFLDDKQQRGVVNVEATGRPFDAVYNGIYQYLQRHPELGVTCVRENGEIVLYRCAGGTN